MFFSSKEFNAFKRSFENEFPVLFDPISLTVSLKAYNILVGSNNSIILSTSISFLSSFTKLLNILLIYSLLLFIFFVSSGFNSFSPNSNNL